MEKGTLKKTYIDEYNSIFTTRNSRFSDEFLVTKISFVILQQNRDGLREKNFVKLVTDQ